MGVNVPTNYPGGVTNVFPYVTLGGFLAPDPTAAHTFFTDFDTYIAGDWTVTETDAGATETLANVDGGVLLLTNTAADDDLVALQNKAETFLFASGKQLWFKARMKVSDATQSDFVMGLQITDTTPLAVTDGVYFQKTDGSAVCSLKVTKNSTTTTTTAATIVDDTWVTLGFVYNGIDRIDIYVDDNRVASSVTTNLVDDEELTISFALQNGEAVAKTMSIDYIFASKQR